MTTTQLTLENNVKEQQEDADPYEVVPLITIKICYDSLPILCNRINTLGLTNDSQYRPPIMLHTPCLIAEKILDFISFGSFNLQLHWA